MNKNMFSDGSLSAYAELPVPAAYLSWTRGAAALEAIKAIDPGAYFGGWRAFVLGQDDQLLPKLPLPVVDRVSQDGKHKYQVFATNVLNFLPLQHRTRFELRSHTTDPETGREYDKVVAISHKRQPNSAPYRQVFGLVFAPDKDEYAPGVIKIYKWSAYITFERAGQAWNKIAVPEGMALIRRYGNIGLKDGSPEFEKYKQGYSTPIQPIGLTSPRFFKITEELVSLWEGSKAWKECERWNAEGEIMDEAEKSAKIAFLEKVDALGLTNVEIEQLLAENNNNYVAALASLKGEDELSVDDINAALAEDDKL